MCLDRRFRSIHSEDASICTLRQCPCVHESSRYGHGRRSYGGQGDMSPLLFEVGGRNVFCPPYFLGEQIPIML